MQPPARKPRFPVRRGPVRRAGASAAAAAQTGICLGTAEKRPNGRGTRGVAQGGEQFGYRSGLQQGVAGCHPNYFRANGMPRIRNVSFPTLLNDYFSNSAWCWLSRGPEAEARAGGTQEAAPAQAHARAPCRKKTTTKHRNKGMHDVDAGVDSGLSTDAPTPIAMRGRALPIAPAFQTFPRHKLHVRCAKQRRRDDSLPAGARVEARGAHAWVCMHGACACCKHPQA